MVQIRLLDKKIEKEMRKFVPAAHGFVLWCRMALTDFMKNMEDKRMNKTKDVALLGFAIAFILVTVLWTLVFIDVKKGAMHHATLTQSQQQTIEAQQTIMEVQKGLISGLVLEINAAGAEAADYRKKWLDAIEKMHGDLGSVGFRDPLISSLSC